MRLDKFANIFLLTIIIGGGALYLFNEQEQQVADQDAGHVYLTSLANKINLVNQIVITESDKTTRLLLKNDIWGVAEKDSYPADFSKVKKLILTLADMKTVESKTSKAESYGRLGVQTVGDKGDEESREIQLLDKAGNVIEAVIIGKKRLTKTPGSGASLYVRKSTEQQSWLVTGEIVLPRSQKDWLNTAVINIEASRIQSVNIQHSDKTTLAIAKKDKTDKHFSVHNLPNNVELVSESAADSIANVLQNMTSNDVLARGKFKITDDAITHVEFMTFDELVIMAKLAKKDDKQFIWFDSKTSSDDENVKAESQKLNETFALWVYEIPEFKAKEMAKKIDDLIKQPEDNKS